jgi:hypothetical protein
MHESRADMKDLQHTSTAFVLRFSRLFGLGPSLSFPCDGAGRVDLDSLGERARCNYFYARTAIGREFAMPAVQPGVRE